jgi:hypothetical protein
MKHSIGLIRPLTVVIYRHKKLLCLIKNVKKLAGF